jgi:hypothetical protein
MNRSILPAPCKGVHTIGTTYYCPYCGALTDQLPTWRYQRKEGWGDIWRTTTENPFREGFFEAPDDWRVERLDTPVPNGH